MVVKRNALNQKDKVSGEQKYLYDSDFNRLKNDEILCNSNTDLEYKNLGFEIFPSNFRVSSQRRCESSDVMDT
jgi:hypothetical protein